MRVAKSKSTNFYSINKHVFFMKKCMRQFLINLLYQLTQAAGGFFKPTKTNFCVYTVEIGAFTRYTFDANLTYGLIDANRIWRDLIMSNGSDIAAPHSEVWGWTPPDIMSGFVFFNVVFARGSQVLFLVRQKNTSG